MSDKTPEEIAKEIASWLYGMNEDFSEGLFRTLIDKISEAVYSERAVADELRKENEFLKTTLAHERLARQTKAV